MFKKILALLITATFTLTASELSFAAGCNMQGNHAQTAQADSNSQAKPEAASQSASKEAVNVGNKICPVTGEKIDEKNKVTYEYEGKIYNFCCPMCIPEFKKDPQKYIKKIEEEKKGAASGQKPQ